MKITHIAVDVDGTLTFADKTLDLNGIKAVKRANEAGLKVILASGIPVFGLRPLAGFLKTEPYFIGENGGVVFDGDEIHVLSKPEKAKKCFDELKEKYPFVDIYSKADLRLSEVCIKNNIEIEKVREFTDKHGLNAVNTSFATHLIESGIDKGSALKFLSEKIGFKLEECAAIGDSHNDIEMIREVKLGVAVENAVKDLKDIADFVTKNSHGAGALEAVEYVIKNF